MNLVIVESPTKARTLSRYLGQDYQIEATMGHIRDLPKSKLGVDIDHDFTPDYIVVRGRAERIKKLQDEAKKSDSVILATDPDREGEAIAWHVVNLLDSNSKLRRIVFHEITESAIKEALAHPREIDMHLVDAQQARRILDRLVGYKLSPLLWYKVRKGLSAGRVQSVAVRLIVEREREIEAFKPVEYWLIEAELAQQTTHSTSSVQVNNKQQTTTFFAKLIEQDGQKIGVTNKDQADQIVTDLQKSTYSVTNVEKKEMRRYSYPPFTTSTMQQAAANRYGFSAKKTMMIAQGLYEEGHITYHRTDSTNIAKSAISDVRDYINKVYGVSYLPDAPKYYKTRSKVAQEAHEAIRPTGLNVQQSVTNNQLGRDADRLYELIFKRFVACQMKEAVYDQTSVDIMAGAYKLRANGSLIKFVGWMAVYGESQKSKVKSDEEQDTTEKTRIDQEENRLPELSVGEVLNLIKLTPQQKFTEPPPRYNEATLIKALEEKGIGRPSTYAPIISTIVDRQYVERSDRRFRASALGIAVNDFLVSNFPGIVDYDFTAKMEGDLDSIASGELPWVPTIRAFFEPFIAHLATVYKEAKRVKIATEDINEACPTCGKPLVIRIGRFGKFVACSAYPACKFTRQYIEKIGILCPKCAGDVILRKTKKGRVFYGCSNYPTCDYASWTKPKIEPRKMSFAKPDIL